MNERERNLGESRTVTEVDRWGVRRVVGGHVTINPKRKPEPVYVCSDCGHIVHDDEVDADYDDGVWIALPSTCPECDGTLEDA